MKRSLLTFITIVCCIAGTSLSLYAAPNIPGEPKVAEETTFSAPTFLTCVLTSMTTAAIEWYEPEGIGGIGDTEVIGVYKTKDTDSILIATVERGVKKDTINPIEEDYSYFLRVLRKSDSTYLSIPSATFTTPPPFGAPQLISYKFTGETYYSEIITAELDWSDPDGQTVDSPYVIALFEIDESENPIRRVHNNNGEPKKFNINLEEEVVENGQPKTKVKKYKLFVIASSTNNNIISTSGSETIECIPGPLDLSVRRTKNQGEVILDWTSPKTPSTVTYDSLGIYYTKSSVKPGTVVANTDTTVTISGLEIGDYTFQVAAVYSSGTDVVRIGSKGNEVDFSIYDPARAPEDIKAEVHNAYNSIKVSWTDPDISNVYAYDMIGVNMKCSKDSLFVVDRNIGFLTIDNLDPDTYIFEVYAILSDSTRVGDIGTAPETITISTALPAVANLQYELTGPRKAMLSWDDPTTTTYGIYLNNEATPQHKIGEDLKNFEISNLPLGVSTQIDVCAIKINGEVATIVGEKATTTIRTIPTPEDSLLTFSDTKSGTIAWKRLDTTLKFDSIGIYYGSTIIKVLDSTATTYDFTGLSSSKTFDVCAIREIAPKSFIPVSEKLSFKVVPISAPTDIEVTKVTEPSLKITWIDPEEKGYEYIAIKNKDDSKDISFVAKGVQSFEITNIEAGENYAYELYAASSDNKTLHKAVGESEDAVYAPFQYDLGIRRISPTVGGLKEDSVIVELKNYGDSIKEKGEYRLSYKINSQTTVYETFTIDSLVKNDSILLTFKKAVDLSKFDDYRFRVRIVETPFTDINSDNDDHRDTIRYKEVITYDVIIPEPKDDCITIDPKPGTVEVTRGDSLRIVMTISETCEVADSVIYLVLGKDTVKPQELRGEYLRADAKTYTFIIPYTLLLEDIEIKYDALNNAVGIEDVMDMATRIYTNKNQLYIETDRSKQMRIYTISGQLHNQQKLNAGTTSLVMPKGIYLVVVGDKVQKIIITD